MLSEAKLESLNPLVLQANQESSIGTLIDHQSTQTNHFYVVYSSLLASQSSLPKGRLKKLKMHLMINDLKPINPEHTSTTFSHSLLNEPLVPISLESHNTKALQRLLDSSFHDESDIDTLVNIELSENAYTSSYHFFISSEYKDLYRRFECLFVWPYLLGLVPLD